MQRKKAKRKWFSLSFKEYLSVCIVVWFMGLIASLSLYQRQEELYTCKAWTEARKSDEITVEFIGAVDDVCIINCRKGTPLKELLKQVRFSRNADRKLINSSKVLYFSQTVDVPTKKKSAQKSL